MPRSGTKLLRDLLNNHVAIGIPAAETEFLPDWAARWPSFGDLAQAPPFHALYERTCQSAYFTYLQEEQGRRCPEAEWRAACRSWALADVFEALVRLDAGVAPGSGRIWGDKSPGYIAHLPLLRALYPGCRVIHILRDVRDYALSIRVAWGKDPLRAAQRWVDRVEAARAWGQGDPLYRELRYEDLLAEPEQRLAELCAFLGLPAQPGMSQLKRASENKGSAKGQSSLKRDNVARYSAEMEPDLRQAIESLAGPTLRTLGYPCPEAGPPRRLPLWRMVGGQLHDGLNLVRSDLDQRGLIGALRFRWSVFSESGAWDWSR
jgi:hypothetical protein